MVETDRGIKLILHRVDSGGRALESLHAVGKGIELLLQGHSCGLDGYGGAVKR